MWPRRRIVGEPLLGVLLTLLGMTFEDFENGGSLQIVAVGLAAGLLSPARRALPATLLLMTAVGSAEFTGLVPLLVVAAWSAGRRISGGGKAVGVFALAYVLSLGLTVLQEIRHYGLAVVVFVGALWLLVVIIVPGLAGRYWSQRRTLTDILREYNAQLLRERAMIAGQARSRERQRIAQDMHDSLGHQLTLISVHTGALEVDRELTGRQREAVGVLREASVAAMHELREVVGLLRDGTGHPAMKASPRPSRPSGRRTPRRRRAEWPVSRAWWKRPGARARPLSCGVRARSARSPRPPITRRTASPRRA